MMRLISLIPTALCLTVIASPVMAATDTLLNPVHGTVTYHVGDGAPQTATKSGALPPDAIVMTTPGAAALVTLTDGTEIALGSERRHKSELSARPAHRPR